GRAGDDGHEAGGDGRDRGEEVHQPESRVLVGDLATEAVSDREEGKRQADDRGPDKRRFAEVGGDEVCRGDLRAKTGDAAEEDDEPNPEMVGSRQDRALLVWVVAHSVSRGKRRTGSLRGQV